jgi:hypothetical protein
MNVNNTAKPRAQMYALGEPITEPKRWYGAGRPGESQCCPANRPMTGHEPSAACSSALPRHGVAATAARGLGSLPITRVFPTA